MLGLLSLLAIAYALIVGTAAAIILRRITTAPRDAFAAAVARHHATEPAELNPPMPCEEWQLGNQLPVWDLASEGTNQHTILMIHGWGRSRIDLLNQLQPFRPHASRIVLYDRQGHGDAPAAQSALGPRHALDCAELIRKLNDNTLTIVAESHGCAILLEALNALTDEERQHINRVILIAPALRFDHALRNYLKFKSLPAAPHATIALAIARRRGLLEGNTNLQALTMPVTILHATDDPIVNEASYAQLRNDIPNAECHTFEGHAHLRIAILDADAWDHTINQIMSND